jgi:hypothetical protein
MNTILYIEQGDETHKLSNLNNSPTINTLDMFNIQINKGDIIVTNGMEKPALLRAVVLEVIGVKFDLYNADYPIRRITTKLV